MDLFAAINPLLVVSGFVVGMLVGLTGVGGGSLMTPILVLLFGVHATTAVGTDLLSAAITKTGGTLTHGLKGTVDWRVTGWGKYREFCSGGHPKGRVGSGIPRLLQQL